MKKKVAKSKTVVADPNLVNFHFTPPSAVTNEASPSSMASAHRRAANPRARSSSGINSKFNASQYHRTAEDRKSSRKKASSSMFPLHSSSDHAFLLTRIVNRDHNTSISYSDSYTFHGPDAAVSWDYVRIVKWMIPKANTGNTLQVDRKEDDFSMPVCPICLDQYTVPHISKCGHSFCLTCILYHIQTYHDKTSFPKCPCCALPMHAPDLRPVEFMPVVVPMISSLSHRKKLKPNASAMHSSSYMRFTKLHRQKDCPSPYLPLPRMPRRLSPHVVPCAIEDLDEKYCKFNYISAPHYEQFLQNNLQKLLHLQRQARLSSDTSIMEDMVTSLAVQMIQQMIRRAQEDSHLERQLHAQYRNPVSGFYASQISSLFAVNNNASTKSEALIESSGLLSTSWDYDSPSSLSAQAYPQAASNNTAIRDKTVIGSRSDDQAENFLRRDRGNSITSCNSAQSTGSTSLLMGADPHSSGGSIYANDDEYTFYQAEDGSLCFLSGFDMNCLRTEFSLMHPSRIANETDQSLDKLSLIDPVPHHRPHEVWKLPLPDMVEGVVVAVERIHLTPDIRSRRRFLSHVPLYTDVTFVDIDISYVLSSKTKKIFKKELSKRNQARISRENAAKLDDERLKLEEQERINQLKSRIQRIDPMDEFFQPVIPTQSLSESRPSLAMDDSSLTIPPCARSVHVASAAIPDTSPIFTDASLGTAPVLGLSFSQICQSGDLFPSANAAPTEFNFPALGSSPPSLKKAPPPRPWGNSIKTVPQCTSPDIDVVVPPISGKKSRGKKIVLFSTGAPRNDNF